MSDDYSQLSPMGLVGYLSFHIQKELVEQMLKNSINKSQDLRYLKKYLLNVNSCEPILREFKVLLLPSSLESNFVHKMFAYGIWVTVMFCLSAQHRHVKLKKIIAWIYLWKKIKHG